MQRVRARKISHKMGKTVICNYTYFCLRNYFNYDYYYLKTSDTGVLDSVLASILPLRKHTYQIKETGQHTMINLTLIAITLPLLEEKIMSYSGFFDKPGILAQPFIYF